MRRGGSDESQRCSHMWASDEVKNAGVRNGITLSNTVSMSVHLVPSTRCKNVAF